MGFRIRAVCLAACLALSRPAPGQPPHVTATKLVDAGKQKELLRRINGRWWSQDNREVYPPSVSGVFWELDSKPGVCEFFHHRPAQVERAESLHLVMKKEEVEALLGPPNRSFIRDGHGFWYYYALNGVKLSVRFMEGEVGEANYDRVGEKSWPVASLERELNGRSIYSVLAERAGKRLTIERTRSAQSSTRPSMIAVSPGPAIPREDSTPAAPKRVVPAQEFAAIAPGMTRDEVMARLGEPAGRSTITSDDGTRETLTYGLENRKAVVRLVGGKVIEVR